MRDRHDLPLAVGELAVASAVALLAESGRPWNPVVSSHRGDEGSKRTRLYTDGGRDVTDADEGTDADGGADDADGRDVTDAGGRTDGAGGRTDADGDADDDGRPPDGGDTPDGDATEFALADPDADSFRWGPHGNDRAKTARETSGGTSSGSPDGSPGGSSGRASRDSTGRTTTGPEPPAGADGPAPGPADDGPESLDARLASMERRLDRLSDVGSDLTVAALNGTIKVARDERGDLDVILEDVRTDAERVDEEVTRLREQLAALREAVEAVVEEAVDERRALRATTAPDDVRGASGRPRSLPAWAERLVFPPGVVDRGREERGVPRADTGETAPAEGSADAPGREAGGGTAGPESPDLDPVAPVVPGTKLRDMWRTAARTERNGDGGLTERRGERWILETQPTAASDDDHRAGDADEFPPEVTEFTLDDDEISFEELLDLVLDDPD